MKTTIKFLAIFLIMTAQVLIVSAQEKQVSTEEFNWTTRIMADGIRIDQHEAMINSVGEWEQFYKDKFGIDVDFLNMKIPKMKEGFYQLIVVAPGLTPQKVLDVCKKEFECFILAGDLKDVIDVDRDFPRPYAIWIRNRVETDEDLKGFSVDDLSEIGIYGITLTERLLYELFYYSRTGEHLDTESITLCTSSCRSSGYVPSVYWSPDYRRLRVDWQMPDLAGGRLRARYVVL